MYPHPFLFSGFNFYPSYAADEKLIAREKRRARYQAAKKKKHKNENEKKANSNINTNGNTNS